MIFSTPRPTVATVSLLLCVLFVLQVGVQPIEAFPSGVNGTTVISSQHHNGTLEVPDSTELKTSTTSTLVASADDITPWHFGLLYFVFVILVIGVILLIVLCATCWYMEQYYNKWCCSAR